MRTAKELYEPYNSNFNIPTVTRYNKQITFCLSIVDQVMLDSLLIPSFLYQINGLNYNDIFVRLQHRFKNPFFLPQRKFEKTKDSIIFWGIKENSYPHANGD